MDAPKPASPSPVEQELGLFTERESPYIQDAAPLRYRRWPAANAAKPTLVLIHGLFGDMESWPSLLAAALHLGFGVVCVELPSHGDSPCVAESFDNTVEVVAQTVEAALRHAEANTQAAEPAAAQSAGAVARSTEAAAGPVEPPGESLAAVPNARLVVVGHSLGAAIATRVARRLDPQRIQAMLLFSPAGCGPDINQTFVEGMLDANDNRALEHEINKLTVVPFGLDEAYLDAYGARLKAQRDGLKRLCATVSVNAVQQVDILPDLDELSCPITIVHGREDRIVPWQHALNAPPQVALHIVPRVGHIPYEEAAALVDRILARL